MMAILNERSAGPCPACAVIQTGEYPQMPSGAVGITAALDRDQQLSYCGVL